MNDDIKAAIAEWLKLYRDTGEHSGEFAVEAKDEAYRIFELLEVDYFIPQK